MKKKTNQNLNSGCQYQIQTTSVVSNSNKNKIEIMESIHLTKVTELLPSSKPFWKPLSDAPMHVPPRTIRSISDSQRCAIITETFVSKDVLFDLTKHHYHFSNSATFPYWQFRRTQGRLPLFNQFTD